MLSFVAGKLFQRLFLYCLKSQYRLDISFCHVYALWFLAFLNEGYRIDNLNSNLSINKDLFFVEARIIRRAQGYLRMSGFMIDDHSKKIVIIDNNALKFYSFDDLIFFKISCDFFTRNSSDDLEITKDFTLHFGSLDIPKKKDGSLMDYNKHASIDSVNLLMQFCSPSSSIYSIYLQKYSHPFHDICGKKILNKISIINHYLSAAIYNNNVKQTGNK